MVSYLYFIHLLLFLGERVTGMGIVNPTIMSGAEGGIVFRRVVLYILLLRSRDHKRLEIPSPAAVWACQICLIFFPSSQTGFSD